MKKSIVLLIALMLFACGGSQQVTKQVQNLPKVREQNNEDPTVAVPQNKKGKPKTIVRKQETRLVEKSKGKKAVVVAKETLKGAATGAIVGAATGMVAASAGKEMGIKGIRDDEMVIYSGAGGAVIGATVGVAKGLRKAQEPDKLKVTNVMEIGQVKGLYGVYPHRNVPYVLRVWIAPWLDAQDRLRWIRYAYVDLKINRWSVGERTEVITGKELYEILSKRIEAHPAKEDRIRRFNAKVKNTYKRVKRRFRR